MIIPCQQNQLQTLNSRLKIKQMHHFLLKQNCILCAGHQGGSLGICNACLEDLPWHTHAQCQQCAMPTHGRLCGSCISASPHFDATHALFNYAYPLDRLLQHYKYHDSLHLAHTFSSLWLDKKNHLFSDIDVLIPMPMHPARLKQRGFNQALEIARPLGRKTQIPIDYQSCRRIKLTPPQASLPLKDRVKNIRGVFSYENNLQGQRVAMVDDVMTSGASLNELAKTLKQAGAAHVECWVMARTLPKSD